MRRRSLHQQPTRALVDARRRVEERWERWWEVVPASKGRIAVGPLVAGLVLIAATGFALGYHRTPQRRLSSETGEAGESY